MSIRYLHVILLCALALGFAAVTRAGMTADTPYTQRGKTDFDTALELINPYGAWSKIDGKWAFTPSEHLAPYTDGRWIYTEYGWYWKGRQPHSWLTEHYGYWKRSADKVWSWYPGPFWLPQIVEIRATSKYIGWRSAEVDSDGTFVEAPIDRYSKPGEWTFVTLSQFPNPITPAIVASPEETRLQLENSTECRHTYLTYREIDRPGPHPADFAELCKDGAMLAPKSLADEAQAVTPSAPTPATNTASAIMHGTNRPTLIGTEIDPMADTRQVKYWITMSLPTFWAPPPPDAKSNQVYLYRPDFYQDNDGIARRITLWFNPKERSSLSDILGSGASASKAAPSTAASPDTGGTPAVPATEAPDRAANPFRSPLDEPPPPSTPRSSPSSSKNPAPSPLINSGAQAGTNAAPALPQ